MSLTVSRLARQVGLSADTIRFYEREGLLPEPPRTASGYRAYEPETVDRLRFIRGAQRFGLRLREVRELLEIRDKGQCPCGHTSELVDLRLQEIHREIQRLTQLESELVRLAGKFPAGCIEIGPTGWACETEFMKGGDCCG